MVDHLMMLAREAERRGENGYYENLPRVSHPKRSLRTAVRDCNTKNPVIAEIKYASPSEGQIRSFDCPTRVADEMLDGGACALSVLTAPDSFQGALVNVSDVSVRVDVPVLMKDIIVSPEQIRAGARAGADAVVIVAESGIETSLDVRRLRAAGADAFLVGTAIMKADNVKEKVRELVEA